MLKFPSSADCLFSVKKTPKPFEPVARWLPRAFWSGEISTAAAVGSRSTDNPAPGLLIKMITLHKQLSNSALSSVCVVAGLGL